MIYIYKYDNICSIYCTHNYYVNRKIRKYSVCVCLYIISDAAEQRYMGVQRPWINSWASRRAWRCVRREKWQEPQQWIPTNPPIPNEFRRISGMSDSMMATEENEF